MPLPTPSHQFGRFHHPTKSHNQPEPSCAIILSKAGFLSCARLMDSHVSQLTVTPISKNIHIEEIFTKLFTVNVYS